MVDVNQQNKKNRGSTFSSAVRTFAIYRKICFYNNSKREKEKKEIGNLGLPDSVRQVLKDSSTYHFFDLMTLSVQ